MMKRILMSLLVAIGMTGKVGADTLSEEGFADRFVATLRAVSPQLKISVTDRLRVQVIGDEGEYTVFLDNAFSEYLRDPSLESDILNRYVASCLESLGETEPIKQENIIPVIKDRAWLSEIRKSVGSAQRQVVEDLNEDLVIIYAEDTPRNTRYFSPKELEKIGLEPKELRVLALSNLRRILPAIEQHPGPLVSMLTAGGDYVASLVLLEEVWTSGSLKVDGDIVVAIPSRDVLLFTGSNSEAGIRLLRELAHKAVNESSYGLTDQLFVYRKGEFKRYSE